MVNVPNALPDYYDRTPTELDLLAEQLLVLQRIERSLETLMTLGVLQANALEKLLARETDLAPDAPDDCRAHTCSYYRWYLAYGPADLTHEGFHQAEQQAHAHMNQCSRSPERGICPICSDWEKRLRA
jgi:hypothetical protein